MKPDEWPEKNFREFIKPALSGAGAASLEEIFLLYSSYVLKLSGQREPHCWWMKLYVTLECRPAFIKVNMDVEDSTHPSLCWPYSDMVQYLRIRWIREWRTEGNHIVARTVKIGRNTHQIGWNKQWMFKIWEAASPINWGRSIYFPWLGEPSWS